MKSAGRVSGCKPIIRVPEDRYRRRHLGRLDDETPAGRGVTQSARRWRGERTTSRPRRHVNTSRRRREAFPPVSAFPLDDDQSDGVGLTSPVSVRGGSATFTNNLFRVPIVGPASIHTAEEVVDDNEGIEPAGPEATEEQPGESDVRLAASVRPRPRRLSRTGKSVSSASCNRLGRMTFLSGGRKGRRRPTLTVWLWLLAAGASFVAAAAVIARV